MMTQQQKLLAGSLHIASTGLMIAGWLLPILSIDIYADVPIIGRYYFLQETRSVFGTIGKLFENGNWFPALLILLFGIAIPLLKMIAVFGVLFSNKNGLKPATRFVLSLSKWAMADVFALGMLIAFLAANSLGQTRAEFHAGFYFFAAFVITGLIVSQLLLRWHHLPQKNGAGLVPQSNEMPQRE